MKLDYDCVRECLILLEDKLELNENLEFSTIVGDEIKTELKEIFSLPTITYSLMKLEEADYIEASVIFDNGCVQFVEVSDITCSGHEFLNSIRSQTVWNKTKNILSKIGSASFAIISQVATPILNDFIRSQTGL